MNISQNQKHIHITISNDTNNENTMTRSHKICLTLLFSIYAILLLACLFFIVTSFYIYDENEYTCGTIMNLSLWLFVYSISCCATVLFSFIPCRVYTNYVKIFKSLSKLINIFLIASILFNCILVICGMIIFFGHCNNYHNNIIEKFMWGIMYFNAGIVLCILLYLMYENIKKNCLKIFKKICNFC